VSVLHPHDRRGFSLLELLVAISVVLILTALVMSVSTALVRASEVRDTQTVLRLLDTAVREWEARSDRRLTWWNVGDPPDLKLSADIRADTPEVLIITEMLSVITRPAQVRAIVARIDEEYLYRYEADAPPPWIDSPQETAALASRFDRAQTVLDAWGTPIYATHPGRLDDGGPGFGIVDPDGTIRTYNEWIYGVARNRQMCFVSAGPDRLFGRMDAEPGTPEYEQTKDNVYSYEVDRPGAAY
jgi:prepilin-type N-terminal cleavage/methylation domain-containing protein